MCGLLDLSVPQVGLDLANLAELLLRIRGADRGGNDHIVTDLPVNRGSDTLLVTGLKRIDDTQHLGRVTTSRGGIHHGQTDLLARVDDEDRANGESNALLVDVVQILLVDHVIQEGDLAVRIGDNGELHIGRGDFIDVFDPFVVRANVIGALE